MLNMDGIERAITGGLYEEPGQGQYVPTLVVGLGGSGIKTLRYLKSNLMRHQVRSVELLGIDSDASENSKWPHLPALDETELVVLDQGVATSALARAAAGADGERHVLGYLPARHDELGDIHGEVRKKIAAQMGAGQFRRAGRLLFQANVNGGKNLTAKVGGIRQRLQGLAQRIQEEQKGYRVAPGAKIFVVTSLSGGTGAGSVLDCIALLRHMFSGDQDVITLFSFLPGPLLDRDLRNPYQERPVTRGNCVALLRELQAFDQGDLSKYQFQFDRQSKAGPFQIFVNDHYLIGDHLNDGTAANSYMELTHALAQFLYAFVGAGVGAVAESGAINGKIKSGAVRDAVLLTFSSLGAASLEYPVQELAGYGVRYSLGKWGADWLGTQDADADVAADADALLGAAPLFLKSFESLRAVFLPPASEMRATTFLADPTLRKAFLQEPDEVFVSKGLERVSAIDAALQGLGDTFDRNATIWRKDAVAHVENSIRGSLQHGIRKAQGQADSVGKRLDAFLNRLKKSREARDVAIEKLKEELAKLAADIHFWDFQLDRGLRRRFLEKIDALLGHKVDQAVDSYMAAQVTELGNAVTQLRARLEGLQRSATVWVTQNEAELGRIRTQEDAPSFVQRAIPYAEFPGWAEALGIQVPVFVPEQLDWESMLKHALSLIKEDYHAALHGLDLVRDAASNRELARRIGTLDAASGVLLRRTPDGPPEQQLEPQKFVAGTFQPNDALVASQFSAPANQSMCTIVPTKNPHMVICLQTSHGFGAAHWHGFAEASRFYEENRWYYHALENFEELPNLVRLDGDEAENLRVLGLGLMFELVIQRGNQYSQNLMYSSREDAFYYLVHSLKRSAAASALVTAGLILEPPASQNRTKPQNRLGQSLEGAFENLAKPTFAEFRQRVLELVEEFRGNQGSQALVGLIRDYRAGTLGEQIAQAADRRERLEKIAQALQDYAGGLV